MEQGENYEILRPRSFYFISFGIENTPFESRTSIENPKKAYTIAKALLRKGFTPTITRKTCYIKPNGRWEHDKTIMESLTIGQLEFLANGHNDLKNIVVPSLKLTK